ncbi:MAG: glycosyltransferase, partial [Candidatus Dormibacteria bacterium]
MTPDSMRIALIAPLIAPLREPQLGGVQTFLVDLARGLAGRGHEVAVFAARGSRVDGVRVVDTGVDAALLGATLFRPDRGPDAGARSDSAFATTLALIGSREFDVIHNHAFDIPAIRRATTLATPVLHTLHMPADAAVGAALATARRSAHPPLVAAVSEAQAVSWRRSVEIDAVLRPGIPTATIPSRVSGTSTRLLFAGRLSPEKGAREAVAIARVAGR